MQQDTIELSFCQISFLDDFIIEVITNPSIEVGYSEIEEYHQFFNQLSNPVGVLVNRSNEYSYSFEAIRNIRENDKMAAVAILVLEQSKVASAEYYASLSTSTEPLKVFSQRNVAMDWLNGYRPQG